MDATPFTSPVGRMVQGSLFSGYTTDKKGAPLTVKSGPRAGQPRTQYFIAVAYAKSDPLWPDFERKIKTVAAAAWPRFWPQGPSGPCVRPNFALKIMDGDALDGNGESNADKEGFAGHWVVKFASGFAPNVFPLGRYTVADAITNPASAPLGYYVRVAGTMNTNNSNDTPGIYLNMSVVEVVAAGDVIVPAAVVNAADAFAQPAALPAGARPLGTTPQAGAGSPPPSPPPPPPPKPSASYMAPPPGPVMTPAAAGTTYEAFKSAGWTDDQLRAKSHT